jgi:3-hydroxyisobutyrate dehydrogenase-like beta-hydroxyacid dehydrogenase
MDIGFLGLGAMGSAMVVNLLKAGHRVRVWNRSPGPVQELVARGAQAATSPQDALQAADAVLTILADDQAMRAVLLDSGLLDSAPQGPVHVHMATLSVALAQELTQRYQARGIAYVSAPVFGRPDAAAAAKLHIVAAGDDAALTRVQPLLELLGQKVWRMGNVPARASVVKIAGNFMIASAIEAMGEAVALAQGHGIQARELFEMLTGSLFAAPVYKNYGTIIAERNYETVGAKLTLGLKDVRLALAAGDSANVPLPLASLLRDTLLESVAHGDGSRDWSALAEVSRRRAGQKDGP